MSATKRHTGTVTNGKFQPDDLRQFRMAFYSHEGKRVAVTVSRYNKTRSNNQNRYYWGVVIDVLAHHSEIGYTGQEWHEALKMLFLRVPGDGKKPDTVRSTASLTTAEFEQYNEQIRRWSLETLGCLVPLPNEVEY